jgi:small subunit ribosomal protein S17
VSGEGKAMPERGRPNVKVGVVTSDRMDKSVVVQVERLLQHPMYKRYVRRTARFMAHDEANACKVGDTVEIVESRPLSKLKRWRVRRIVRAAQGAQAEAVAESQGAQRP